MHVPIWICSNNLKGATSPVTPAGGLVTITAEVLGGVVLSQLVSKRAPVIFTSVSLTMDMRAGSGCTGAVENAIVDSAAARMARYYNLPSYCCPSGSDSMVADAQGGIVLGGLRGNAYRTADRGETFTQLQVPVPISFSASAIPNPFGADGSKIEIGIGARGHEAGDAVLEQRPE